MATDGDRHANDADDDCGQLNRTNDHEPDNMSNDDEDADRDVNDHNDDDDDDDAEEELNGGDVSVCKSCARLARSPRCPDSTRSQRRPHGFMVGNRSPTTYGSRSPSSARCSASTATMSCSPRPSATDRTQPTRAPTSTNMLTIKVLTQHPLPYIALTKT